jgi:hypothetical protein
MKHVYGPISGIHFYHAVPFRDLLNLDHKKFDLSSTKASFIVVEKLQSKAHFVVMNLLIDPYPSCKRFFT